MYHCRFSRRGVVRILFCFLRYVDPTQGLWNKILKRSRGERIQRGNSRGNLSLSLSLSLLSVSGASDKLKKLPSKKNRVTGFRSQESDAPYEIRMKGYKNIHKVLTEWTGWRFGQNR